MDAVEWDRLEAVFEGALGLTPEARENYLNQACGSDAQFRAQVVSLLRHADEAPGFLDQVAGNVLQPAIGALLEARDPLVGTAVSHYRIEARLGGGGMGVVYRAHDTRLDRTVALKFLPENLTRDVQARERFVVEARAASALDHPNICTIYDIDQSEAGRTFIAMGYVEGETLKARLTRGPLPIPLVIAFALQIAEALSAAHRKGIIHRDVKPANVMIAAGGTVKLVDFGLAKLVDVTLTATGVTPGTVAYMSPEQIRGDELDARSDLWSLGVVLYEMLTGTRPFRSASEQGTIYAILTAAPEPVSHLRADVPEALATLVDLLLAKDRDGRPADAEEVISKLRATLGYASAPGTPARSRRYISLAVAAGMALLVLFIGFLWYFNRGARPGIADAPAHSLAVMYFENQTPEDNLERVLVNLLTTNLARYKGVEVVSNQRLFDILKQLGQQDAPYVTQEVATEVARKAAVRNMVVGSIIQLGDQIRINAQLVDARTGQILASVQESGGGVEDIFPMVDRMTEEIAQQMQLESGAQSLNVTDVTTRSYEAMKAYQRGIEHTLRWEWEDARNSLLEAARIDTTFAMAYAWLGHIEGNLSFWQTGSHTAAPQAIRYLEQAQRHADKATFREQRMITVWYNHLLGRNDVAERELKEWLRYYPRDNEALSIAASYATGRGDYDSAISYYEQILALSPSDPMVINILAYTHAQAGHGQQAIDASRRYIALQPDVMNTYDSAWEVAVLVRRLDDAYRVTQEALARNPAWIDFHRMAGDTRLLQERPDLARTEYHRMLAKEAPDPVGADLYSGVSFAYEGRYEEAIRSFVRARNEAMRVRDTLKTARALLYEGIVRVHQGLDARQQFDKASQWAALKKDLPLQIRIAYQQAQASRASGNRGRFQADRMVLIGLINRLGDSSHRDFLKMLDAESMLDQKRAKEALAQLKEVSYMLKRYSPDYLRLKADIEARSGNPAEAARIYSDLRLDVMRQRYGSDPLTYFLERSSMDYRLGRFYEQAGDRVRALEHYQAQLKRWAHADAGNPLRSDLLLRLRRNNE